MQSIFLIVFFSFDICNSFSQILFNKFITLTFSSFLNGETNDIKIHSLSDGSGYYVTGTDSSSRANIWKYNEVKN